jgi:hypothetical protein
MQSMKFFCAKCLFLKFAVIFSISVLRDRIATCKPLHLDLYPRFAGRADRGSARVARSVKGKINLCTRYTKTKEFTRKFAAAARRARGVICSSLLFI